MVSLSNIIFSSNDTAISNSYLDTQFFFYMLPYYYGLLAFIYRYYVVIENEKKFYIKPIFLQSILSFLQTNSQNQQIILPYKHLSASYQIKNKLSLFNAIIFLIMVLLSFLTTHELFYAANHPLYSLLYICGSLAWYLSCFILKKEQQRQINQSLWTHRFFWIFCGVFSITKMFEDYFLPLNLIINSLFLITNVLLTIYALYRPEDSQTLQMIRSDDIPSFIKTVFSSLQLNTYVRWMFDIQDLQRKSMIQTNQVQYIDGKEYEIIDDKKIQQIQNSLKNQKQTAKNIRQQINLLNTLPRRNIFIDKKLRYNKQNDKFKPYFFILTQIGNVRFQVQRKYNQFIYLDNDFQQIFNAKNFPKNQAPKIIDIANKIKNGRQSLASDDFSNKAQILQKWLQQITKQPLFMIKPLLLFLSIDEQNSAPFITYFQFSHKSLCSKNYLITKHNQQKINQEQIRQSLIGYYENQQTVEVQQNKKLKSFIKQKLLFKIAINQQINDQKQFGFWITCQSLKKGKIKWLIRKYQDNILQLNQRIQDQCKVSVPFYYKIFSGLTRVSHKIKSAAYRQYLQKLLQTDIYYSISLFQFIRFDPIKMEPKLLNTQMSFSKADLLQKERQSRYFQTYQDKGGFIQVLRLDKIAPSNNQIPIGQENTQLIGQNQFKFSLRRKGTTLSNKKTSQIMELRQKLSKLYKGISNVPSLQLSNCSKVQLKNRIQKFLLKIESLPKIQINGDYLKFYQTNKII